jgi:hypothetical protein
MKILDFYLFALYKKYGRMNSSGPNIILFTLATNFFTLLLVSIGWYVSIDNLWVVYLNILIWGCLFNVILFDINRKYSKKVYGRLIEKYKTVPARLWDTRQAYIIVYISLTFALLVVALWAVTKYR